MIFAQQIDKKSTEEGLELAPKFDKNGQLPVFVSTVGTQKPLQHLPMTEELLKSLLASRTISLTSVGNDEPVQVTISQVKADCDQDCIWVLIEPPEGSADTLATFTQDIKSGLGGITPQFNDAGLIPCASIDYKTGELLMFAWMNADSLQNTIDLQEGVYWSRSRKELWHKGATSGLAQKVHGLFLNTAADTVLMVVDSVGGACCHVGYRSCFYREIPVCTDPGASQSPVPLAFTETEKVFDPKVVYGK